MGKTFTLETGGQFYVYPGHPLFATMPEHVFTWSDLDAFTQGYIEALFAASEYFVDGPDVDPLGFSDLAPETLARIIEDCEPDARGYVHPTSATMGYSSDAEGGLTFWVDRQAGVWAGFPPLTVTLNDDGKVSLSPTRGGGDR